MMPLAEMHSLANAVVPHASYPMSQYSGGLEFDALTNIASRDAHTEQDGLPQTAILQLALCHAGENWWSERRLQRSWRW